MTLKSFKVHVWFIYQINTLEHSMNLHRARTWQWSTSQTPVDFEFWLVAFPHLLVILATSFLPLKITYIFKHFHHFNNWHI